MTSVQFFGMDQRDDSVDAILGCLKQMESTLLGMKQPRRYLGKGLAVEMLDPRLQNEGSEDYNKEGR